MSPARRLEILATVGHKNRLPFGTNDGEVQELGPLLRPLGWPQYQLTPAGWRAIEMAGQQVLRTRGSSGTDAA
jgi:hypothetical protein